MVAWELFSLLYYGFQFPNTAYAKLKTGIPGSELATQGLIYLGDSLQRDPVTLAAVFTALALTAARPSPRTWPIAAGVLASVGSVWPRGTEPWREMRRQRQPYAIFCCVGALGYFAGPHVYVVDEVGLGDPLLARLPARRPWRIGHFTRDIPAGYVESIESGENRIEDPGVAAYYDRLRTMTRGPLRGLDRFRVIAAMNLGRYEHLLRQGTPAGAD